MLSRCVCCGVIEVEEIWGSTAWRNLQNIWEHLELDVGFEGRNLGAYIMFTDHINMRYGRALAKLIKKQRLGKVHRLPVRRNGNTDNPIQVWMWAYNYPKFRALAKRRKWASDPLSDITIRW